MARPIKLIDWGVVKKLCAIFCTHEEIAAVQDCSVDTLERAAKRDLGCSFAEFVDQKRRIGAISLRRKQRQLAMKGDRVMLIWLGKQILGQREPISLKLEDIPDSLLINEAQRRLNAKNSKP